MKLEDSHPAVELAGLALISGVLGSIVEGPGFGQAPALGLYLVLAGAWFGCVLAYGVKRWGAGTWPAAFAALIATWAGWELAVNTALQIDAYWNRGDVQPGWLGIYLSGFVAGAVGALVSWAGVAGSTPHLRTAACAAGIVLAGALLGLLLPSTNHYDNGVVLLVPWQMGVAACFGFALAGRVQNDAHRAAA